MPLSNNYGGSPQEATPPLARWQVLRAIVRSLAPVCVIGAVLSVPFVVADVYAHFSKARIFAQIRIGMSGSEARNILESGQIWCGLAGKGRGPECRFSDFWRDYEIMVDSERKVVTGKSFRFRRHRSLLKRLEALFR